MTKDQLFKTLEDYPGNEEILINCKPLFGGEATWFNIACVDINIPATILIENEPCMY